MPVCRFEPALVEAVILAELEQSERRGDQRLTRAYHRAADPLYETTAPDQLNAAFDELHADFFNQWGFARLVAATFNEFPELQKRAPSLLVLAARSKSEEGAVIGRDGNSVCLRLLTGRFADRDRLGAFIRHELLHAADMLDDAFGYRVEYSESIGAANLLADRYRGGIHAYQVWNEPNLSREWGGQPPDPTGYVELLKACYVAIKRADPNALVISAGMAPTGTWTEGIMPDAMFVERMYEAGAAPYFDLLGAHAPGFKAPPEASPDEVAANPELGGQRFFSFRHVEDLREIMVRHGDAGKQVAVLEMGWTTDPIHPEYAWHAVDEQTQADYLVRAFDFARQNWSPWISIMTVIGLADPVWTPDDEQYWWTVVYPDWPETRVKPAYEALKAMPKE